MFGDGPVEAINHGLGLAGQVRNAERALAAFYARFRNINDVTHGLHPSDQSSLVQSTLESICVESPWEIASGQEVESATPILPGLTQADSKSSYRRLDPQWSGQKRPTVVRSKPANGCGPGLKMFYPVVRILGKPNRRVDS